MVAFGSAPGLPNFGGLLRRIRHELQDPAHHEWDTLYIVDSCRNWYEGDFFFWAVPSSTCRDAVSWTSHAHLLAAVQGTRKLTQLHFAGGCDSGFASYSERLQAIAGRYQRVLMLGDSMGASAALMFSNLATCVQVFTPQVNVAPLCLCNAPLKNRKRPCVPTWSEVFLAGAVGGLAGTNLMGCMHSGI